MIDEDTLTALKTAFTFMPQPVEINPDTSPNSCY